LIQVKNLTKRYGRVPAVNDISFSIDDVGVYGFLGPNGAGKSTTMNILTGCLAATSGEVKICGFDIYEDGVEAKELIGYLPENPPLYPDMTPAEYLSFVASAKGITGHRVRKEVDRVMGLTNIEGMSTRLIKNLSKGYKQRVGIAQALLGDPKVIILDEPTVGLDPIQIIEIRELITRLGKNHLVLLSSHILPEISAVCDYVIMIAHGRIVASDTLENLNRSVAEEEILRIETKGDGEKLRRAVSTVEGVADCSVQTNSGKVRAEISVVKGNDIREAVSGVMRELDMPVLSFVSTAKSLEEIFIQLVYAQNDVEEDPALPTAKKVKKDKPSSAAGRAYYDDNNGAEEEEYTSIFAKTDDTADDSSENN